jgi:WD40 repeat protein
MFFVWDLRTGQLVLVLDTRDDTATDMAFSPSGATLAVALYEDGVQLWRLADGVLLHTLRGEDEGYAASKSIALSPDGQLLAAGNFEAEDVWLWRVADGQLVRKMDEHPRAGRVLGLAFSPDGRLLVCGDGGGEKDVTLMRVWDVSTGRAVAGFPRKEWMPVFSSDGLLLASARIARGTGPISIWDVAARTEVQQLLGHTGQVSRMAFSPSGHVLVSCSEDRTARWWDVQRGQEIHRLEALLSTHTSSAFSPDTRLLATSTWDGKIRLWRTSDGKLLHILQHHGFHSEGVAFSADGNEVAAWTQLPIFSGMIDIYYTQRGEVRLELRGINKWVFCAAFNHDDTLLAAGCEENAIEIWRLSDRALLHTMEGHGERVCCLAFSPSEDLLASGAKDGTVLLWRIGEGNPMAILVGHTQGVTSLTFSPDGSLLASGSEDHAIRIWNSRTGHLQRLLQGHSDTVVSLAFSSDGKRIATCSRDKSVRVWNVTGKRSALERVKSSKAAIQWRCSLDGSQLEPEMRQESVLLWSLPKGMTEYLITQEHTQLTGVAFQPDDSLLAAGYCSGPTGLWRLEQWG